ncbi:MAG: (2Fe-2S)-binding protein [Proteobacteria bacterium]|nr:(2Fe-2S)-binding protein [Pseudomonadota bacterium]
MPTVQFAGQSVECLQGSNLRMVLVRARLPLYNDAARALNCRGRGRCGTCTVRIEGPVSEPTEAERARLKLPPDGEDRGLRLACQCTVLGDITVTKLGGFFGRREEPDKA